MLRSYLLDGAVITTKQTPDGRAEFVVHTESIAEYLSGWFNFFGFELIFTARNYRKCPAKPKGGIPVPMKRSRFAYYY